MKKFILFILFQLFFCVLTTEAQNDTLRFIIKFSPTSFLDVDAGVQLGIENKISQNLSVQNEFSYLFYPGIFNVNLFNNGSNNRNDMAGFTYKLELRKYNVSRKKELGGFYWSPQLMYKQINWSEEQSYQTLAKLDTNGNVYYNTSYNYSTHPTYTKRVAALNFKIGRQYISSSGFAFDWYVGLGVRGVQTIQTSAKINFNYYDYSNTNSTLEDPKVMPNFTMGFRLGWYFQVPIVTN